MSVRADEVPFNWKDPFLLEEQLTEEERMVRDTAKQYAQNELLPRVREAYRLEKTDPEMPGERHRLTMTTDGYHFEQSNS